ncbi:ABC transporter permease [Microbacterium atlanticum]|uniref:ABC transporter permease n=1 Tax=Microbacterium atlanticum TaxID=2782168 RepID=UPI0018886878|nr:ABC transporter permease [Microbacterium atlanticum]
MSAFLVERPPTSRFRAFRRHPVVRFLVTRVLAGLGTLVIVSFVIYAATRALPGDAVEIILGRNATPELVAELRSRLGLDQSLLEGWWNWFTAALAGDLGVSTAALAQGNTVYVADQIAGPLTNSLILAVTTLVILIPLCLALGTWMGLRAGRLGDRVASQTMLVLGSLPEFVLGTFLIAIFFAWLHVLPPLAMVGPAGPLADPSALILPILTLLGVLVAFVARQIRAGVIESLRQEYVTMARLSGIREGRVVRAYALRNSLAPGVQAIAQSMQYLVGGIIVVEALFAYPGIGQTLVNAISLRDIALVQAIALILAATYIIINILADLLVMLLVPTLRTAGR